MKDLHHFLGHQLGLLSRCALDIAKGVFQQNRPIAARREFELPISISTHIIEPKCSRRSLHRKCVVDRQGSRDCATAWPGRGSLALGDASALVLYTEYDEHTWDSERGIVACGSWLPTPQMLANASWTDPFHWT